jgi:hypothetical protein
MLTVLALLLTLLGPSPQKRCVPQFAPLDTGTSSSGTNLKHWRKEEAGSWGGNDWIGWTHESVQLVQVALIVRPFADKDDVFEEDRVTVEWRPKDVSFAVRCIATVRVGRIKAAAVVNHELDYDGPLDIPLGERRYTLRLERSREDPTDARVVLSDGTVKQVLYSTDGFVDEPHFYVEWAGDLDGDGRLDLVVNLSRKYSMHPHRLLLSTKAKKSELVGDAAVFETGN